MSKVSENYLQKVEKHFVNGIPIQHMSLSERGKLRLRRCKEAYNLFVGNPMIDLRQTLRNIARRDGVDLTPIELSNDMAVLNHITSFLTTGVREIKRRKVEYASDWLIKQGMDTGNDRAVTSGAKIKMDLNQNFSGESEGYDKLADMPIVITDDVSVVKPDRKNLTDEERAKLFQKYGVNRKQMEDLVQSADGTYETAPIDDEEEDDLYDENR